MKKILFLIIALGVIFIIFLLVNHPKTETNMILTNGKIYTFDSKNSVAEAIAIGGDKILYAGTTEDVLRNFKSEKIIDLKGKIVLPGLIDGHAHILGEGGRLETLDLVGVTSPDQIVEILKDKVQKSKPGEWIIGRGWDQNNWQEKVFPNRNMLDQVSSENPILLRRVDGHAAWVNTKTIQLAGITSLTKDPEGGKIFRDEKGNPTGIFLDNAIELINRIIPELTNIEIERRLLIAMQECAQYGLTEVHDMGVDFSTINVYKKLINEGKCPIRIYAAIDYPSETWNKYLQIGPENNYGNGYLTVRAVKLYMDGALGSRGAALIDEYSDDPGNRGLTIMSEREIDSVCQNAEKMGFQVCTHAIGDRANNLVLNAYERNFTSIRKTSDSLRWRIEHAQILLASDIPRFRQLNVIPAMQPTHATSDMGWAEDRIGHERIKGAYAWQSILKTGSVIIGGSDFPVEAVNPLFGIYAAITREDKRGNPPEGWLSKERMTREQAIRCFTLWPAYGAFQENLKGTIEVGKWADLTVLSKDIMTVDPKDILSTSVDITIVGGKIVYQNPSLKL